MLVGTGGHSMKNMQQIMKQAQKMQEQLQKQMAEMSVEGSSGGGMVSIKMNGLKQVLGVKIEPDAATSGDVEMLQDLIIAAFNEAARKVDEELSGQIGNLTGGIKIPGLF
jgi:nucleoid-associated protein EbfC